VYDERIVATGISQGRLFLFVIELLGENYVFNKVVNLGKSDSLAVHSMEVSENTVYMADSYNNKIYKYDFISNDFLETNVGRDPRHMCLDNENIYVANFESDNISIIDLNLFTLTGSIPAGIKAHDVIYSEKNNSLYTSCYEENEVVEYIIDNGRSRSFRTEGKPMHLFELNDTIMAMTYYANGNIHTKINFINLNSTMIEDIIVMDGLCSDFLLDYENNMLYIINIVDKSLYTIDAVLRKIIKKVYLGGYPESLACGKNNIYVTNSKRQQITIINKKEHNLRVIDLEFVPDLIKVIH
jgi:YVTN family beta-propeller protein